jgi:hypothetical protein
MNAKLKANDVPHTGRVKRRRMVAVKYLGAVGASRPTAYLLMRPGGDGG